MVVANLLENAIIGVKELEKQRRLVETKIRCASDYLLIDIKNEYEGEIIFDAKTGLPKSHKGKNHGLGMQSVEAFADKINGNLGCYCQDNFIHIVLFAKFQEQHPYYNCPCIEMLMSNTRANVLFSDIKGLGKLAKGKIKDTVIHLIAYITVTKFYPCFPP